MPNIEALRAVRQQRDLELEAVAEFAAIAPTSLERIEAGEREPSRRQIQRLAEAYGVPTYSFFVPGIPNLPPLPTDFRKADPSPAKLSPRELKSIIAAEQISIFSAQLAGALGYKPIDLLRGARP